ncbi:MAG: hypothetical protein AAF264_04790 [Pseudomonadota bacterium]
MGYGRQRPGAEAFSLSLWRDGTTEAVRVRRATMSRPGVRHRLAFTSHDRLDDVLAPALADRLRPVVATAMDDAPARLDHPREMIALPGLILGGLTLTVGRPRVGGLSAILRFRYFIGGLQTAFAARTGFDCPSLAHREALSLRALDDVARPLLDMAGALSTLPQVQHDPRAAAGMARTLAVVEAQAADLDFYAGLLRRYVGDCDPARLNRFAADPVVRMTALLEPPLPAFRRCEADRHRPTAASGDPKRRPGAANGITTRRHPSDRRPVSPDPSDDLDKGP